MLPRIHGFELHDLRGCPEFVRESIVETLGNALRWGGVYRPVAETFSEWCSRGSVDHVLDLCSGTGEPVATLVDALRDGGAAVPRFTMSDLYPNRARLEAVAARYPEHVAVAPAPVDATSVDVGFGGNGRTIVSAFHHFPPAVAAAILADCVRSRTPLFVLEPAPRTIGEGVGMLPLLAAGALANPFVAPSNRIAKLIGMFAVPILPFAIAWDTVASLLRMYSEAELLALTPGSDDYRWEYRKIAVRSGSSVTVFMGWPEVPGR